MEELKWRTTTRLEEGTLASLTKDNTTDVRRERKLAERETICQGL